MEDRLDRAFVHGWMKEVNWDRRTAQLHRSVGNYIQLRFDAAHDGDMLLLATQYVEVSGQGRFNQRWRLDDGSRQAHQRDTLWAGTV